MSVDDLQRLASLLRWIGLAVTAIGLLITLASHLVADHLLVAQRAEKAAAQEKLSASQAELQATKQKTAELEEAQRPWQMTAADIALLRAQLAEVPKGKVRIEYIQSDEKRARPFAEQLSNILKKSGFDVWGYMSPFTRVNAPTLVGVDMSYKTQEARPIAAGLKTAFSAISLNTPIAVRSPQDSTYDDSQVVIYVGLRP